MSISSGSSAVWLAHSVRDAGVRGSNPLSPTGISSMFIKDLKECNEFISGDNAILRELFHPDKARLKLRYSLAHAVVRPRQRTRPHKLKTSEVYYILEGEGEMHIDEQAAKVCPGQAIYIPPNSIQFVQNTGKKDLIFLCIVDPAWRKEDEEVY
jgi:mannose-6-phosphate isomerase-like protein (cupin superfamily)